MAMGVYLGPGSLKELKSCYVGAGGVKTVSEIYVGVGGSAKKVWPAFTDYGGDSLELYNGDTSAATLFDEHYGYMIRYCTNSGYSERSSFGVFTNSYGGTGSGGNGSSYAFNSSYNCHWYSMGPIDTRGYNYLLVYMRAGMYSQGRTTFHMWPILGYNTIPTNNPWYGGNYAIGDYFNFGQSSGSSGNYNTDRYYIMYDFTNINQESTYLQFGGQLVAGSSEYAGYCGLSFTSCVMSKSKPSSYDGQATF